MVAIDSKLVQVKIKDLKKKYAKHRMDHGLNQLSNTSVLKKTRREIARHLTQLRQQLRSPQASAPVKKDDQPAAK